MTGEPVEICDIVDVSSYQSRVRELLVQCGYRAVLAVPGVIGLTVRQSMFQRRSGLITVTATTAAGVQHYEVPDVPVELARPLATTLLPECRSFLTAPAADQPETGSVLLRDASGVSRLPA